MSKKRIAVLLSVAGVLAAAALFAPRPQEAPASVSSVQPRVEAEQGLAPRELPEREALGRQRVNPFASPAPAPAPAKPVARAAGPVPVAAPPAPPPMPYRVAGRVMRGNVTEVVLAKGDTVLSVRIGDVLDDGYRVAAIEPEGVTLVYVPLDARQTLPISSSLGPEAAPPARAAAGAAAGANASLRWEGPSEVRAGNPFDVVLRVTSPQPLRSSPLQLSYDAKLLEPVSVRPGGFFADGMFSYRLNAGGSIFIGAAGKGAVAADADIVIVSFRPLLPGTTAELKLSSVMLQSAAGRAIALDQPAAFRTAIVQ
ncbi:MAG TPA: cohesin domain-containing protein [Burkholderiales bacterium]|nr:cohesin domain-containing protein [Burkholderiales bacterium]